MAFGIDVEKYMHPFVHKMEEFTHGIERVIVLLEIIVEAVEQQAEQRKEGSPDDAQR